MQTAVMIIDMRELERKNLSLCYRIKKAGSNECTGLFEDLTNLLDCTERFGLPLVITTYFGFEDHLSEVQGHVAFKKARVFDKRTFNAFNNPEVDAYLRTLKINELILAGFNLTACVAETAKGAADNGYRVATAKTVLYTYSSSLPINGGYLKPEVIETCFASLHDTVNELFDNLTLRNEHRVKS